ncbi:hypothetical protein [Vibrio atypicus]|uniref:hypothetical protein n=1 Tax=Vibrio atypicus TaxID=558271 RepID=UPI00135A0116|nr:hypothetical protein [Vibrio atypicus]
MKISSDVIDIDGYLFLHQENKAQEQIAYLSGQKKLSPEVVSNFKFNIAYNKHVLSSLDIKTLHVIFPAKPVAFRKMFENNGVNINSLYNHQSFDEIRDLIYYPDVHISDYLKTDTHNSDLGKVRIISNLLKRVGYDITGFTPVYRHKSIMGDLSKMIKGGEELVEEFCFFSQNPFNCIEAYSTSKCLVGNSGHIDYHINGNAIFKERIVLFGDSFFRTALHIWNKLFQEVIYFRSPFIINDICELLKPNLVLTGNAERYLVNSRKHVDSPPYLAYFLSDKYDSKSLTEKDVLGFSKLFLPRESTKSWISSLSVNIPKLKQNNPLEISIDDVISDKDVDYVRDMANYYFENNQKEYARHLIDLAYKFRPSEFISKQRETFTSSFT